MACTCRSSVNIHSDETVNKLIVIVVEQFFEVLILRQLFFLLRQGHIVLVGIVFQLEDVWELISVVQFLILVGVEVKVNSLEMEDENVRELSE